MRIRHPQPRHRGTTNLLTVVVSQPWMPTPPSRPGFCCTSRSARAGQAEVDFGSAKVSAFAPCCTCSPSQDGIAKAGADGQFRCRLLGDQGLRSKPMTIQMGKEVYSAPTSCWEFGETSGVNAEQGLSPDWQKARRRHWWGKDAALQKEAFGSTQCAAGEATPGNALPCREAFKKRFAGRCFRCLDLDHQVAQCRDLVRCLTCKRLGHFSRSCPASRHEAISTNLRSSLCLPGWEHQQLNHILPAPPHRPNHHASHTELTLQLTAAIIYGCQDGVRAWPRLFTAPTFGRVAIVFFF